MASRQSVDITELSVLGGQFSLRLMQLGFRLMQVMDAAGRDQYHYVVPPVCEVPAGSFLMGSDELRDPDASDDEQPQFEVIVPAYNVARYPLTVAEYACFVQAAQYSVPYDWDQQQCLDHPVVCISWYDVWAYIQWLNQVTGEAWRLPTEAEWEKAARGTDGRIFPWGDRWDNKRANTRGSWPQTMTPVGNYPGGASPYGVQDMAGNVWEWTSTIHENLRFTYPYSGNDGREDVADTTSCRVLRGGSWRIRRIARAAYRQGFPPSAFNNDIGARLALSVPAETEYVNFPTKHR